MRRVPYILEVVRDCMSRFIVIKLPHFTCTCLYVYRSDRLVICRSDDVAD